MHAFSCLELKNEKYLKLKLLIGCKLLGWFINIVTSVNASTPSHLGNVFFTTPPLD